MSELLLDSVYETLEAAALAQRRGELCDCFLEQTACSLLGFLDATRMPVVELKCDPNTDVRLVRRHVQKAVAAHFYFNYSGPGAPPPAEPPRTPLDVLRRFFDPDSK